MNVALELRTMWPAKVIAGASGAKADVVVSMLSTR